MKPQAMTTTFASYAAVAIENARLYDSAQEQAYASAALLQVAQAIVSLSDLDEMSRYDHPYHADPCRRGTGRSLSMGCGQRMSTVPRSSMASVKQDEADFLESFLFAG